MTAAQIMQARESAVNETWRAWLEDQPMQWLMPEQISAMDDTAEYAAHNTPTHDVIRLQSE